MADLAFEHELDAHKNPYRLERSKVPEVTYTPKEREQIDEMFPDIFDREPHLQPQPGFLRMGNPECEWPSLPRDPCEPLITDPNWCGPWPDDFVSNDDFGLGAEFKAKHRTNHNVSKPEPEPKKGNTWSGLTQVAQHLLLKVACDYHLQKFTGIDFSSKEKRKTVFKDATISLSLSEEQVDGLINKYHVKGRRAPEAPALFNPKKHLSTISYNIAPEVTSLVEEARKYVDDNFCTHLNKAIDQIASKFDQNVLDTTYFGVPEITERWKPDQGTIAEKLTVAAFSISTGTKGKCSDRLLLHQLLLPPGSFFYSPCGVRRLSEDDAGVHRLKYPENYVKAFAKNETTEILMCTAKSFSDTDDINNVCQDYNGPAFVNPAQLQCKPHEHVNSSFHTLWGAGGTAPIGPQLFSPEKNQQLQKANKDFEGFHGFLQFYLPPGVECYSASGKKVSLDVPPHSLKPDDEIPPCRGGWYTIMTSDFAPNAFNGREQQVFNNDFIFRIKPTEPVALLRDHELMPRLTEPGVHDFSITDGHGVDLRSENGDYYMWNDMIAPEEAWAKKFRASNPEYLPGPDLETEQAEWESARYYDLAESESEFDDLFASVCHLSEEEVIASINATNVVSITQPEIIQEESASAQQTVTTEIQSSVMNPEDDEKTHKRNAVCSAADETLNAHKSWLEADENTAVNQDRKHDLKQAEEVRRARIVEEQKQKQTDPPRRSRPIRHDPEDDDYIDRTGPATKVTKRKYQKKDTAAAVAATKAGRAQRGASVVAGSTLAAENPYLTTKKASKAKVTNTKVNNPKAKKFQASGTEGSGSKSSANKASADRVNRRSASVEPTAASTRPRRSVSVEPQPAQAVRPTTTNLKKKKSVASSAENYGTAAQDRPRRSRSISVEPTAASTRPRRSVSVEPKPIWTGTANLKRSKAMLGKSKTTQPAKKRKTKDDRDDQSVASKVTIKNVNKANPKATSIATTNINDSAVSRKRGASEESGERPFKSRKTEDDRAESSTQKKRKEITERAREKKLKQSVLLRVGGQHSAEVCVDSNDSEPMDIDTSQKPGSKTARFKGLADSSLPTIDEGDTTDLDNDGTIEQSTLSNRKKDPYTYYTDLKTGQPRFNLNVESLDPEVRAAIKKKIDSGERLRSESFSEFNIPPPCPERLKALNRAELQPAASPSLSQAPISPPRAAGDANLNQHLQPITTSMNINMNANAQASSNNDSQVRINIPLMIQILTANNLLAIPPAVAINNPGLVLTAWQNMQLIMATQMQGAQLSGFQSVPVAANAAWSQLPTPTSPMFPFPFPMPQIQAQTQTQARSDQSGRITELSSSPQASPRKAESSNDPIEIRGSINDLQRD